VVSVEGESEVDGVLKRALELGLRVVEVVPRHETLEDLFVREAIDARRADAGTTADG
jgi:hypothetical protein